MVETLKKIDKKILLIVGIILLLPIVIIIFLAIIQGCGNSKITPEKFEEKMISSAEKYFKENGGLPKKESEVKVVNLDELVKGEYIKSTEDLLGDDSCKGSVTVRKNGSTIEKNEGGFLNYIVSLECDEYKTKTLNSVLMNDLTTSGSGLYKDGNYYVYKGDQVKNYIEFFGKNYRIMNIDEKGVAKLIKTESESLDEYWDNKYNVETEDISGKNIYADSTVLKKLIENYSNNKIISENARKHIVSKDVCVDSRSLEDGSIGNYDCTNKLANQVISLIDINDFARASLDVDCTSIYSRSCRNYNYLKELNLMTWTVNAVSDNTYGVYYLSSGVIRSQEAGKYQNYNIVIYIDTNEKITSGKGTVDEPYVLK
ncbi:MAG: hypothetical protein IKL65_05865 [Bacilli bacterium]|nr:hypothetical protein [Bacilli bacterium]